MGDKKREVSDTQVDPNTLHIQKGGKEKNIREEEGNISKAQKPTKSKIQH